MKRVVGVREVENQFSFSRHVPIAIANKAVTICNSYLKTSNKIHCKM